MTAMTDSRPTCPKCGTRACVTVLMKARVRAELNVDGTVGRVLSTSREGVVVVGYECRGGHSWEG